MSARTFLATSLALPVLFALVGGCGSETTAPTVGEAPILPPQNVVVTQSPSGPVYITWDANTQSTLKGYNVYRRDTGTSSIAKLTTKPTTVTSFVDRQVDWQSEYEYRVTTVSTRGGESGFIVSVIQLEPPTPADRKHRARE